MILLDTHAFIWLASDHSQLSHSAKKLISESQSGIYTSVVTAWEITMLVKRGRLTLPLAPAEFIDTTINFYGLTELDLSRKTAESSVNLPDIHNDPFDRILIAEAIERNLILISKDRKIAKYPDVEVIW